MEVKLPIWFFTFLWFITWFSNLQMKILIPFSILNLNTFQMVLKRLDLDIICYFHSCFKILKHYNIQIFIMGKLLGIVGFHFFKLVKVCLKHETFFWFTPPCFRFGYNPKTKVATLNIWWYCCASFWCAFDETWCYTHRLKKNWLVCWFVQWFFKFVLWNF